MIKQIAHQAVEESKEFDKWTWIGMAITSSMVLITTLYNDVLGVALMIVVALIWAPWDTARRLSTPD